MYNRNIAKKNDRPGTDVLSPVTTIMSPKVVWFNESDPLEVAVTLFERCHISSAPVKSESGEYVGVVTKTDFFSRELFRSITEKGLKGILVKDIMTPIPIFLIEEHASIQSAARLMLANEIHHLFVKDPRGTIVGVVSSYDILKSALDIDDESLDPNGPQTSVARELLRHSMQSGSQSS